MDVEMEIDDVKATLNNLTKDLQRDRLINLQIGPDDSIRTFKVQVSALVNCSTSFAERVQESPNDTIRFDKEEDEKRVDVWQVFLYWLFSRRLPPNNMVIDDIHFAIRCWVFGDKYAIQDFQNNVMLALLHHFKTKDDQMITVDLLNDVFTSTETGSPLQRLIGEQTILQEQVDGKPDLQLSEAELEELDETGNGFLAFSIKMRQEFHQQGKRKWPGAADKSKGGRAHWSDYLVGPRDVINGLYFISGGDD